MLAYWVQYGRCGFVGRLTSAVTLTRGDRVVLRSGRGVEIGSVLCEVRERFATTGAADGEILRLADNADETRHDELAERASQRLAQANAAARDHQLPLTFVDAEWTFDDQLILHGLAWQNCDATALLEELSAQFAMPVRFLDVARLPSDGPPKAKGGCGSSGCGSGCSSCGSSSTGPGGCGTGSCSRGQATSAAELTTYFAHLRQQMEAVARSRLPLA
jgi:hypothetical protein